MNQHTIRAPFFEIGPKSYLYGQDVVDLAIAADKASEKYGVDIIFTTPIVSISAVKAATKHIHVFAPHMDPLEPGRGLADKDGIGRQDQFVPGQILLRPPQAQRASCSIMWKSR